MTNEEAIKELRDMLNRDIAEYGEFESEYICEATEMAIEALQHWRVITKRPMTDEERIDYAERLGCDIEDEDAVIFYNLPEDGKEVLVCTLYGHIYIDTLFSDYCGCYFEEAGDMESVIAWMPLPEPYKEAKCEH